MWLTWDSYTGSFKISGSSCTSGSTSRRHVWLLPRDDLSSVNISINSSYGLKRYWLVDQEVQMSIIIIIIITLRNSQHASFPRLRVNPAKQDLIPMTHLRFVYWISHSRRFIIRIDMFVAHFNCELLKVVHAIWMWLIDDWAIAYLGLIQWILPVSCGLSCVSPTHWL